MKPIKRLKEKHKKELEALQKKCKHKDTAWAEYHWAPAHGTGRKVKICEDCGKWLEEK